MARVTKDVVKRWAANSVTKNKRREIFTQIGGYWSPHHVDEIAYSFWSLGDNNLNLVLLKRNNNTPPPPDGQRMLSSFSTHKIVFPKVLYLQLRLIEFLVIFISCEIE